MTFLWKTEGQISGNHKKIYAIYLSYYRNRPKLWFLKIDSDKNITQLLNAYISSSLIPTITRPTRITHTMATLIDNIFLKHNTNFDIHSGIIISDISDHMPIFCLYGNSSPAKKQSKPLDDAFVSKLNDLMELCMPVKKVVIQPQHIIRDPWMTKGLIISSKINSKLYRKCHNKEHHHPDYICYIKYRNLFNRLKCKAKIIYYENKFDIKGTWKTLRAIIGNQNDKTTIIQNFKIDNETVSDSKSIADGFCKYFSNVGPEFANKIPKSNQSPHHYLILNWKKRRNNTSIFLSPTDPDEIHKIIKSLKSKKNCGNDQLTSKFFKSVAETISVPISILINISLETALVPNSLKLAKVIPIYKAKAKDDFSNYRPISILPSVSKILEKVIHKRLYFFMQNSKLFFSNQYGFRQNHSTLQAVTKLITDII